MLFNAYYSPNCASIMCQGLEKREWEERCVQVSEEHQRMEVLNGEGKGGRGGRGRGGMEERK